MNKLSGESTVGGQVSASYSRFSSNLQREESITGQQSKCREAAIRNGHQILPELEFSDEAVSGTKRDRKGLNRVREAARRGDFKILYFYSLSRLARESVIAMPLLKELVYNHHIRIISVTEGIDSARDGWEMLATLMCMQHERFIHDLSTSVLRGQESTVLANYSVGDYCFGYTSIPDPHGAVVGRGRHTKPRMVYAIDPENSEWVQRIFAWFAEERQSLTWITHELNRLKAPKDHRSTTPNWHHQYVSRLLRNRKYVGDWPWGEKKNCRNPLTGQVRQEPRPADQTEKWFRHFPELRIIPDDLFAAAQIRLDQFAQQDADARAKNGRLEGSRTGGDHRQPRYLLSGLIRCGHCQSDKRFHVGGAHGKYLFCPGHHKGLCDCKTQLPRERAESMILTAIQERILDNKKWEDAVLQEAVRNYREMSAGMPDDIRKTEADLSAAERKIQRLLDIAEDDAPSQDLRQRLNSRTEERDRLKRSLTALKSRQLQTPTPPTLEWVRTQLQHLTEILSAGEPTANEALKEIVGGAITVTEIRREGYSRHYLQGRFRISASLLADVIQPRTGSAAADQAEDSTLNDEIILDFREEDLKAQLAEDAKRHWDAGLKYTEIAKQLGRNRNLIQAAIAYWHESRGLPKPDGRSHRKRLHTPRLAEQLLDQVAVLEQDGLPYGEIAKKLGCDRNIVTEAVKLFYEKQGLPVPDGRTRRKRLREAREDHPEEPTS